MSDLYTHRTFNGHLGRLSAEQEKALDTFKTNLEEAGLYKPATDSEKASHDDATVLRFLRARKFDLNKAQKQFSEWIAWREKHDVDNLFANFDEDEFEASRRYYPRWTGRRDKQGLPIYVYRLSSLTDDIYKEITAVPPARRYQRIVVLYEAMLRFVSPLCTYLPHDISPTPVSSVTTIIDLENVSLGKMWTFRSHLQEASTLANANYPETLGTIVVVNSPSFFPTVWGWIKGWFDEYTREKIHILGKNAGSTIKTLIDEKDLPRAYGGELDWKFEDDPALDEDITKAIGKMPRGPVIFDDGEVKRPKEYQSATNGSETSIEEGSATASARTSDCGSEQEDTSRTEPEDVKGVDADQVKAEVTPAKEVNVGA